jgi:hypothetical protein
MKLDVTVDQKSLKKTLTELEDRVESSAKSGTYRVAHKGKERAITALENTRRPYNSPHLRNNFEIDRGYSDATYAITNPLDYAAYVDQGVSGTQNQRDTEFAYTSSMPPLEEMIEYVEARMGSWNIDTDPDNPFDPNRIQNIPNDPSSLREPENESELVSGEAERDGTLVEVTVQDDVSGDFEAGETVIGTVVDVDSSRRRVKIRRKENPVNFSKPSTEGGAGDNYKITSIQDYEATSTEERRRIVKRAVDSLSLQQLSEQGIEDLNNVFGTNADRVDFTRSAKENIQKNLKSNIEDIDSRSGFESIQNTLDRLDSISRIPPDVNTKGHSQYNINIVKPNAIRTKEDLPDTVLHELFHGTHSVRNVGVDTYRPIEEFEDITYKFDRDGDPQTPNTTTGKDLQNAQKHVLSTRLSNPIGNYDSSLVRKLARYERSFPVNSTDLSAPLPKDMKRGGVYLFELTDNTYEQYKVLSNKDLGDGDRAITYKILKGNNVGSTKTVLIDKFKFDDKFLRHEITVLDEFADDYRPDSSLDDVEKVHSAVNRAFYKAGRFQKALDFEGPVTDDNVSLSPTPRPYSLRGANETLTTLAEQMLGSKEDGKNKFPNFDTFLTFYAQNPYLWEQFLETYGATERMERFIEEARERTGFYPEKQ